jgi:carbamoyltransferase
MRILGLSFGFHDAGVCMLNNEIIEFASHSERYSKVKNDPWLNHDIIAEAIKNGKPDVIVLHEKAWAKRLRNVFAGNWSALREPTQREWINKFYPELKDIPIVDYWHHETHAAAGVLTSKFDNATVMVIDAIGEVDTATIWDWNCGILEKKDSMKFPNSLGLFYSAITALVGLKPMEDEYILMGMAAYGEPKYAKYLEKTLFKNSTLKTRKNLQRGLPKNFLNRDQCTTVDEFGHTKIDYDIAASAQKVVEDKVMAYARKAKKITKHKNLVFMGGVSLNCVANSLLHNLFDNIYIMPNPGDCGSSLGAAALYLYNETGKLVNWYDPYLGYNIEGKYPIEKSLESLRAGEIFGIANGRAEFGPRALGNRTLCSDPRGSTVKDKMNVIKKRQKFRPFAPMILEEHVHEYFEMPGGISHAPYMQFVAKCKKPDEFPAIVHKDGTSRVQTVRRSEHPELHKLLTLFYKETGCPMLVNTSLNIKGQPIVNDEKDAQAFATHYGVKVHVRD